MGRKSREEINRIKKVYGVENIYSWSKMQTYMNDPFEYFLKYIKHEKEDLETNAYGWMGGKSHDILESFYNKEIEYKEMLTTWEDVILEFDISGLKYDRRDKKADGKIKRKYEENMNHFFKNHVPTKANKRLNEAFVLTKVGRFLFQGYIDTLEVLKDGDFNWYMPTDYKTSTMYNKNKLRDNQGQLLLYVLGVSQMKKIPIKNFKARWNFLKYSTVKYQLKNGNKKVRHIERIQLVSKLKAQIVTKMKSLGYSSKEIDSNIQLAEDTNDLSVLPKDVKDQFDVGDCYVYIDINQDVINLFVEKVINILEEIEEKTQEYEETKDEKVFWKEVTEKDTYYLNNLGGYSRKLHKPYDEYLNKKDKYKGGVSDEDELLDLFGEEFFNE